MLETSAPILLGGARSSEPEVTDPQESEFARIEALLALRTRNLGTLQREFDRRDRLLREALERLGVSSGQELATLRQRHDAAIDRALEAEFACAELRFALDETRAQLTAAPTSAAPTATAVGTDTQVLRARVSELEQCEQQMRTRLHAVEQEKIASAERVTTLERELLDARTRLERSELTWAQERSVQDGGQDALAGERAGLQLRLDEVERAWRSAAGRAHVAQVRHDETREKLVASQAERAELSLRVQASGARALELEQALAVTQQELTRLRAELTAVHHERTAQTEAFDAERHGFQAQLHQVGGQVSGGDAQLLEALSAAQRRVSELETALSSRPAPAPANSEAPETRPDVSPGPLVDALTAERAKRRKLAVTVRALQAASEAGEAIAPWIDELVDLLAEYTSLPPRTA
jgi:hypothetical protein